MQINSRFDIGDVVWRALRTKAQVWRACLFCAGTGQITGADGTSQQCPRCTWGNGGKAEYISLDPWALEGPLTIASVRIVHYSKAIGKVYEEEYMMDETGCPSGAVHGLGNTNLFKSKQAAMDYADRENAILEEPEGVVVCECGGVSGCPKCHGYGRYVVNDEEAE